MPYNKLEFCQLNIFKVTLETFSLGLLFVISPSPYAKPHEKWKLSEAKAKWFSNPIYHCGPVSLLSQVGQGYLSFGVSYSVFQIQACFLGKKKNWYVSFLSTLVCMRRDDHPLFLCFLPFYSLLHQHTGQQEVLRKQEFGTLYNILSIVYRTVPDNLADVH